MSDQASDDDAVLQSWQVRAEAYDGLVRRWPEFRAMAGRLVTLVLEHDPGALDGPVVDLAGGSGLVGEALVAAGARELVLVEPAPRMCELAAARLGSTLRSVVMARAEDCVGRPGLPEGLNASAVLCSAAFHLMDEARVLSEVARVLRPGGVFATNLWGHSFDETAGLETDPETSTESSGPDWRALLEPELARRGAELPETRGEPPRLRTRAGLARAATRAGLELVDLRLDEDDSCAAMILDFLAMSPRFLGFLAPEVRAEVLIAALRRGRERQPSRSVRLAFRRPAGL